MAVVATTHISYGNEDGSVKEYNIGDEITGLDEEQVRSLVQGGSAVETGADRKYSEPVNPTTALDEETRKRDALIAESMSGTTGGIPAEDTDVEPRATDSSAESTQTLGQSAARLRSESGPSTT